MWAVIVGAGPIGLMAANMLGQQGIPTLLLEKNEQLSTHPKALMVDDEFLRLLNSVGLADQVGQHGVGPVGFEVYSPLGFRVLKTAGRVTENGYATRTATFQPAFERILRRGLERFPHVELRLGHELIEIDNKPGSVELTVRRPDGRVEHLSAHYLLAADGARSAIRKWLDIEFEELLAFGQRQIVVDVEDDPDTSLVAVTRLGWRRNFASLPAPGGRRYEFSLRPGEDADELLSDASLTALFRQQGLSYGAMKLLRKVVYTFHSRLAVSMHKGRVFLLGDAAHIMPVFGSQGMNSGARDVNNLQWKLAAVYRGVAGSELLESYDEERRRHVAETVRIATNSGRLQSVRRLPVTLARDVLLGALSMIPNFRRYVADMRYIPKPYVRSGFVLHTRVERVAREEAVDGAAALIGRVLPMARVVRGDGSARLDDVIGLRFALLGIGIDHCDGNGNGIAAPATSGLSHTLWKRLGTAVITLHKSGDSASAGAERLILADAAFDGIMSTCQGRWIVVRPDRVVAAITDTAGLQGVALALSKRLGQPHSSPTPSIQGVAA